MTWHRYAACTGNPEPFIKRTDEAAAICGGCPVINQCSEWSYTLEAVATNMTCAGRYPAAGLDQYAAAIKLHGT